jgi:hypothetical protein
MTTFPNSPNLLKGALIGLDPANPLASVIIFQYNPDTMTRRLDARSTGSADGGDRSEAFRLSGPPRETITLNVEFDAADQVDQPGAQTTFGVYPALSALEMLLYPKSAVVIANTALALLGNIEIIPPEAPPTFFVWGPQRVLPVRLTGFSITEQAYDGFLNPIQAKVDLSLYVLSYADLKLTNPSYYIFLAHQIAKETLATSNVVSGVQNLGVPFPFNV